MYTEPTHITSITLLICQVGRDEIYLRRVCSNISSMRKYNSCISNKNEMLDSICIIHLICRYFMSVLIFAVISK